MYINIYAENIAHNLAQPKYINSLVYTEACLYPNRLGYYVHMARISKQNLTPQQAQDLSDQLTEVIGRMNSKLAQHFLSEFFGKEEKVMFAKRLAIIALIHQGRPIHRIATYLHVSESTVAKMHERYEKGEFSFTIKVLTKNKADYEKFLGILETILSVGGIMPPRNYVIKKRR